MHKPLSCSVTTYAFLYLSHLKMIQEQLQILFPPTAKACKVKGVTARLSGLGNEVPMGPSYLYALEQSTPTMLHQYMFNHSASQYMEMSVSSK